jgi:hypothetical protein
LPPPIRRSRVALRADSRGRRRRGTSAKAASMPHATGIRPGPAQRHVFGLRPAVSWPARRRCWRRSGLVPRRGLYPAAERGRRRGGQVRVTLARSGRTLDVPRGQSLLSAFEAQGLRPASGAAWASATPARAPSARAKPATCTPANSRPRPVTALKLCISGAATDLVLDLLMNASASRPMSPQPRIDRREQDALPPNSTRCARAPWPTWAKRDARYSAASSSGYATPKSQERAAVRRRLRSAILLPRGSPACAAGAVQDPGEHGAGPQCDPRQYDFMADPHLNGGPTSGTSRDQRELAPYAQLPPPHLHQTCAAWTTTSATAAAPLPRAGWKPFHLAQAADRGGDSRSCSNGAWGAEPQARALVRRQDHQGPDGELFRPAGRKMLARCQGLRAVPAAGAVLPGGARPTWCQPAANL